MSDLPYVLDDEIGPAPTETLASHVIIVDDELVVRELVVKILAREQDLAVTTFGSAEAALHAMKELRVDVALVDKNLPGMSGIAFMAQARQLQPFIESIMMTGYPSPESVIAALASGASDYLVKPFDEIALVRAKVRAALERREERVRHREMAKSVAKQASELLASGKDAPEIAWQRLEDSFGKYDLAVRAGAEGTVRVIGSGPVLDELVAAGLNATSAEENEPLLETADVVLIQTSAPTWRNLVSRLRTEATDVILVAASDADLGDLLEAMSMKLELVGFGGHAPGSIAERVRGSLMRRCVQRAQGTLAMALSDFRKELGE